MNTREIWGYAPDASQAPLLAHRHKQADKRWDKGQGPEKKEEGENQKRDKMKDGRDGEMYSPQLQHLLPAL